MTPGPGPGREPADRSPRGGAAGVPPRRPRGRGDTSSGAGERRPDPRYVTLGAVCLAGDRLRDVARVATGASRLAGGPVRRLGRTVVPTAVRRRASELAVGLDEHGRAAVGARPAAGASEGAGGDAHVLGIADRLVAQAQGRVVEAVVPVLLDRLARESEQLRSVVQEQSRGLVEELATTVRSRAASGDETVDWLMTRLQRRVARRDVRDVRDAGQAAPAPRPGAEDPPAE